MSLRFFLLFFIGLTSLSAFAGSAVLKIHSSAIFFSASGRTLIQNGELVDIRSLDYSKPSCNTKGVGVSTIDDVLGDLSFSRETTASGTQFKGNFTHYGQLGGYLFLHCSSTAKDMTIEDINSTLGSIAELK